VTPTAPPARPPPTPAIPQPGGGAAMASRSPAEAWRRWQLPLVIIGVIIFGGILIALIKPASGPANGYLDPGNTSPTGTRALADILASQGTQVTRVTTAAAAAAAVGRGATTIVIGSPDLLTGAQLRILAEAPAELVIVEPDQAALTALAPGVTIAGGTVVGPVQPRCPLAAAQLAGNADMGGTELRLAPGVPGTTCYPTGRLASLVQYSGIRQEITVLGTAEPLENYSLARLGNAALALNLLGHHGQLAWLVPRLALAQGGPPPAGPQSPARLIPLGTYLVAAELGVAVLLTALWRSRRLGPLSIEQLPVVVRAAETTEGHARLYQARRARDRAAAALRDAALRRLAPALGLPAGPAPEAVSAALAARSTLSAAQLQQLLFGPAPPSDSALVRLADDLDAMEKEVRAQ
jgi:Domain of unknown function (DUF4350)